MFVPTIDVARLRPLAEGLARRIARQRADVDDLVQTGLLAYLADYPRHLKRSRHIARHTESKAWSFAKFVLRRAMLRYYNSAQERGSQASVSLQQEGIALERFASQDLGKQTDLLELSDYFDALERACGRTARLIAENLVAPHGSCAARLFTEMQRKRQKQRNGYSPHNPRVRFSQRAMRDALALDKPTWDASLQQVRTFTRDWFSKTA